VAALAHQGDADGAAQSIRTMGRLGETLRDEPVLISLLVRIAITRMNCETVRQTLPHVAYSNQQLVDMDAMLSERSFADGFHEALLGERVFGILAGEDPSTMGPGNATLPRFMKNAGIVHYLNAMSRPVEIAAGDGPEVLTELQELQEEIELQIKTDRSFDKIFTAILLPAFHAGAEAAVKGEVELDATRAAIAIERYRRHHGRLPATLDALVPDLRCRRKSCDNLQRWPQSARRRRPKRRRRRCEVRDRLARVRRDRDDHSRRSTATRPWTRA
jgi:hypothetical protein